MKKKYLYFTIAMLMTLIFVSIYGMNILNPIYVDWLLTGNDLTQHYIGWQSYRISEWTFPIGNSNYLSYPYSTSVLFTDSIPLLAVIFKIISPILPDNFQYFGLYGLLCFILQGFYSTKIIQRFTDNKIALIICSMLVALSPTFIWRMFNHTSLSSHWLLLMSLDTIFGYKDYCKNNEIYVKWALISLFATSIHIYFILICGIILTGYCLYDVLHTRKIKKSFILLAIYLSVAVIVIFLLGGFSSSINPTTVDSLGFYSSNLNTLYNSYAWSDIFTALPYIGITQGEGYAYLGAGIFLLIFCALILLICKKKFKTLIINNKNLFLPLLIICIISFVIALSPTVTFNEQILFTIPLPDIILKILSVFRASGRLIWIVFYTLVISFLVLSCKLFKKKTLIALLTICFLLQIYDLHSILIYINKQYTTDYSTENNLFSDPIWEEIAQNSEIKHVVFSKAIQPFDFQNIYKITDWAINHNLTTNDFYFARSIEDKVNIELENTFSNISDDYIFVFLKENVTDCRNYDLNYYSVGDYVIGYKNELTLGTLFSTLIHIETTFGDNSYLIGGYDDALGRHLPKDAYSFGPYWHVPSGTYNVAINGTNVNKPNITLTSNKGNNQIEFMTLVNKPDTIIFQFTTELEIDDLEVFIANNSDYDIIINSIFLDEIENGHTPY